MYADPFEERRKEDTPAECVFAREVVQNSRKWKRDSVLMKKGARQIGWPIHSR